jgi:hypothetical protein
MLWSQRGHFTPVSRKVNHIPALQLAIERRIMLDHTISPETYRVMPPHNFAPTMHMAMPNTKHMLEKGR